MFAFLSQPEGGFAPFSVSCATAILVTEEVLPSNLTAADRMRVKDTLRALREANERLNKTYHEIYKSETNQRLNEIMSKTH